MDMWCLSITTFLGEWLAGWALKTLGCVWTQAPLQLNHLYNGFGGTSLTLSLSFFVLFTINSARILPTSNILQTQSRMST
ncbi:hypothetical protein FPSE5266_20251 [Fusarium pseudograminearum]|nr:hypothetical protein FPSE5266_20251 [Fusarium pseudograminearum]